MQMKKRNILSKVVILASLCSAFILIASENMKNFKPKNGYVPNEETAIRIAQAVWIPIYGEKQIEGEKPFRAKLLNGRTWLVEGSLNQSDSDTNDTELGGVASAEIAKDDGRIIRVTHGK